MNIKMFWVACAFSLLASPAFAEEAEITIDIIEEESGDPAQLMNRIELPEAASMEASENSQSGLDAANDAREKGQQQGAEAAAEFRDVINLGREIPLPPELGGSDIQRPEPETPQPPSSPGAP
ncbi:MULTISPECIES: hypothetical protein [Alcanivorax]|uniref:hypothetical protein n=1 Tax=Alcanivorax TaxID=59753 RepID=UPI0025BFE4D5|nr:MULTISPECIES: hypothetical protein [Alcanivorax]MCK5886265.1 hypothetical protein [Alcanivorax sp.]